MNPSCSISQYSPAGEKEASLNTPSPTARCSEPTPQSWDWEEQAGEWPVKGESQEVELNNQLSPATYSEGASNYPSCSTWGQASRNETNLNTSSKPHESLEWTDERPGKWVVTELSQGVEVNWQCSEPAVSGEESTSRKRGNAEPLPGEPVAKKAACRTYISLFYISILKVT